MPQLTAYGKIFRDWEALIGSCLANAGRLDGLDELRIELENVLAEARAAKILQESLAGSRQETTQRLQELVTDGREVARKIRYFVRVQLGSRSELLPAFGVTPYRAKRKIRPGEVVPPSGPELTGDPAPKVDPPTEKDDVD